MKKSFFSRDLCFWRFFLGWRRKTGNYRCHGSRQPLYDRYMTYVSLGVIADGYQHKVYDAQKAARIVKEIISISQVIRKYLQRLIDEKKLGAKDVSFTQ